MEKKPLIIITGPTAAGKTSLSVRLAKALGGEIISADSMQVYRHMDIGSAKVTKEEMEGVPHYLIDVLEPTEPFNVAMFQQMAKEAVQTIYSHGRIPILAGGTGFYIQALLYDINFQETGEDPSIRLSLEALAEEKGGEYLHQLLAQADPQAAEEIHPNNVKRVIRALEYFQQTGQRISEHNQQERQKKSPYAFRYYVINMERSRLYQRIDQRVDLMMQQGLVQEVEKLREMGCRRGMVSMQGLGYKEILDYLNGEISLEEAVYQLKRDTRHFAKRQLTWFKRERQVRWLNWEDFSFQQEKMLDYILKDSAEILPEN
ncbi:MAG TPA: tRNA (adenosine(37)-N6)-dimethylallyltransferase MiaA [Candidatus Cottocaccamicrobium excrementipullorum]|nr:tRNA (adenosine(37)-N6)-dimethylallyltransferase MiaA [Candidatus Cottocaccamicrobium excrementipullorum]